MTASEHYCAHCDDTITGINGDGTCPNDCGETLDHEMLAEYRAEQAEAERDARYNSPDALRRFYGADWL